MNFVNADLVGSAHQALQSLDDAGRRAANASPNSREFGTAQMDLARTTTFDDAMLAAIRARLNELKEITK